MNDMGGTSQNIKYENFVTTGDIFIPRVIETEDSKSGTAIKIRIVKIERPWSGKIKFVPGKGYELIELL
jgi:hypothetical protein